MSHGLAWIMGTSEKIQWICGSYNIRILFQSSSTLWKYLSQIKNSHLKKTWRSVYNYNITSQSILGQTWLAVTRWCDPCHTPPIPEDDLVLGVVGQWVDCRVNPTLIVPVHTSPRPRYVSWSKSWWGSSIVELVRTTTKLCYEEKLEMSSG